MEIDPQNAIIATLSTQEEYNELVNTAKMNVKSYLEDCGYSPEEQNIACFIISYSMFNAITDLSYDKELQAQGEQMKKLADLAKGQMIKEVANV